MDPATGDKELRLRGISVCRGIAIGRPFFPHVVESLRNPLYFSSSPEEEISRYRTAVQRCARDIEQLLVQMEQEGISQGVALIEAHRQMLFDPTFVSIIEEIIKKGTSADTAFCSLLGHYREKFDAPKDPLFKDRFGDFQEIGQRVLNYLCQRQYDSSLSPKGCIVFHQRLSTLEAAEANPEQIAAFVTEEGAFTSHAAIIAKAKGIPYIAAIPFSHLSFSEEQLVIVDARTGDLIIAPTKETLANYERLQTQLTVHMEKLRETTGLCTQTSDGLSIQLSANVESLEEVLLLPQYGKHGVGLLRTENLFLHRESFPDEEEQTLLYHRFVEAMHGLPLTIRTFDVGDDKAFEGEDAVKERHLIAGENSEPKPLFLPRWRSIEPLLREKKVMKQQLRAILRASRQGPVSILFPMISSLSELREAKALVEEARCDLIQEGITTPSLIPIGCMIEVPSAGLIADLLARECDFFSMGTNDLIHYSLAIDRSQAALSSLHAMCHPCLLRLIKMVAQEAHRCSIPVSVCGEIAADPRYTSLLIGLGIEEFSVASRYLPLIKNAISHCNGMAALQLASSALKLKTSQEIQQLVEQTYKHSIPEDCFYNC